MSLRFQASSIGRLGAGGMGRVYLARSGGGRTVAVKVVRADLAEASVWALAGGLAEALRGIRGAGLMHRDLKPSN